MIQIRDKRNILVHTGLNKNIIKQINKADIRFIEHAFLNNYNIDANFSNNKISAGYFALILNIFEELSVRYKLPFDALPPRIRCFNSDKLVSKNIGNAFCITDTKKIFVDESPFEMRSIFIKHIDSCINDAKKIYKDYKNNLRSSGHFLSQGIHEWCHNIHIDKIMKTYGYDGNSQNLQIYYNKKTISNPQGLQVIFNFNKPIKDSCNKQEIINSIGTYAATSKMEFFAEFLTKLITDSLNSKTILPSCNPMDKLYKYSNHLQKLFKTLFEF